MRCLCKVSKFFGVSSTQCERMAITGQRFCSEHVKCKHPITPQKVLIIEGKPYVLYSLIGYLENKYYCTVDTATTIDKLVTNLRKNVYSLIIADDFVENYPHHSIIHDREDILGISVKNETTPLILIDFKKLPRKPNLYRETPALYDDAARDLEEEGLSCQQIVRNVQRKGVDCVDYLRKKLILDTIIDQHHLLMKI